MHALLPDKSRETYEQRDEFAAPQYATVKVFIRHLVALALLPPDLVHAAYQNLLASPVTGDAALDRNTLTFAQYFSRTWMNADKIEWANHYWNDGPRTINHAEGYNNSLRMKFHHQFPRLAVFCVELQQLHNDTADRQVQLSNGADPVARDPDYVRNDQAILACKQQFATALTWITANAVDAGHFQQFLDVEILNFLDAVQHRLA